MNRRSKQVATLIHAVLSRVLLETVEDPYLKNVCVVEVDLSNDLKIATVYLRSLGGEGLSRDSLSHLKKASGFLRSAIAREVSLRSIPQLRFENDVHSENVQRLMGIFNELERDGLPAT